MVSAVEPYMTCNSFHTVCSGSAFVRSSIPGSEVQGVSIYFSQARADASTRLTKVRAGDKPALGSPKHQINPFSKSLNA